MLATEPTKLLHKLTIIELSRKENEKLQEAMGSAKVCGTTFSNQQISRKSGQLDTTLTISITNHKFIIQVLSTTHVKL